MIALPKLRTPGEVIPFSDDFQLRKLECETLIKKYDMLRSELRLHMSRYFDIGKQAQFVVWGVFGAYAFIAKEPTILPKHDNWYIWYFGAILLILTLNYMVMNISESRYAIMHIVARLQMIEMKVNDLIGHSVLEWESTLAERFWNTWRPFPQIVNPGAFTGLYGAALFMAGSIVMPNYIGILLFNVVPRDWAYLTLLCAIPVLSFQHVGLRCGFLEVIL